MRTSDGTLFLDAARPFDRTDDGGTRVRGQVSVSWGSDPAEIKADWLALEAGEPLPFSDYAWAEAWYGRLDRDGADMPVIVIGRGPHGEPYFILPFVLEQRGPFRVLLWPGGTHSGYQHGLFSDACRTHIKNVGAPVFWARVWADLPDADAVAAYGVPETDVAEDHPLAHLPRFGCGCAGHRFALMPDWTALYEAKCNAKMRRNDRRCERRLEEIGEVTFQVARSADERRHLIDVMLEQKSAQLNEMGAPDFTAAPGIARFYHRLATSGEWGRGSEVFIAALELDGDPVAVNLALIKDGCAHGMILSMTNGDVEKFGPGRLLLRRSLAHFCGIGLRSMDLGAGDDPYKMHWADETVRRCDVIVPLTVRGRLFVLGLRTLFAAKARIKNTPVLWRLFSRYRRFLFC